MIILTVNFDYWRSPKLTDRNASTVTPNEIFYHWTKASYSKTRKVKTGEKIPSLSSRGIRKPVIVELTRATADSSKEGDNIVPEIKTLKPPKKLALEIQLVGEMAPDSLGTNPFPNNPERRNLQKLLYPVHAAEGYKYLIPYFNIIMKWQYINLRYITYMRYLHFSNDCSLVIGVLGGIFILNHTNHSIICQSRIPCSEM